ncbi:PAS domain S-box protein [Hymenobacter sp. HD11105]
MINTVDFRTAFEAMPGSFMLIEPNAPQFTILGVSNDLLNITAKERHEVVGNPVFEVFPENPAALAATGPANLRASLRAVLLTKQPDQMPVGRYDVLNTAGEFEARYWSFHNKPVLNPAGEVLYIIHTTQDVTERVQAETSRQAKGEIEKKFGLFMQAPVAVSLVTGPENVVALANDEMLQLLGATSDIVGKSIVEALPFNQELGLVDVLEQVCKTAQPYYRTEYPATLLVNGQFETRYYDYIYQPWHDDPANEGVTGIFTVAYDVTQHVATRRQLVESELRYRTLIEEAPVATALYVGPELRIQYANAIMLSHWGKGKAVLGLPFREAVPELQEQGFADLLDQVYTTGEAYIGVKEQAELVIDGKPQSFYFNFTFKPLRNKEGEVYAIHNTAIDVTEEVLAQRIIEQNEEDLRRFQFMADQARDPFILMREDGSFAYLNKIALENWGYTEEEARHIRVPDVDPIYQDEGFAKLFVSAQNKPIPHLETLHMRKDGSVYPVEVSLSGFELGGKPHLFTVARDITKRKQAEAALKESEERFRIMADAAPNQVWAVNADSSIRYINRAFLEFVGVSMDEYLATGWWPYLHPEEADLAQKTLTDAISGGTLYSMEHRMLRHDGEFRWLLAQGAPSFYPNGDLYGYVGVAIDITELKQANEQLVRINNDLDNFVYTASHDLKAPISNIEGLLHALLDTPPTESMQSEQVQYILRLMQNSVERFTKTIANLTDIVKLQKVNNEEAILVNLAEVIHDVCLDLEPLRQSLGAHITIDVAACPAIHFSAKNLRSAIYNLLSNALKYSSPDRQAQVTIRCATAAEYYVLTVQDNGLGIEAGRMDQLFTMFRRFHDHVEGSGIGLYMIKKMVENVGGKIEAESQVGQGSTFRIYFRR